MFGTNFPVWCQVNLYRFLSLISFFWYFGRPLNWGQLVGVTIFFCIKKVSEFIPNSNRFQIYIDNFQMYFKLSFCFIGSQEIHRKITGKWLDIYWFSCDFPVNFLWTQKPQRIAESRTVWTVWTGKEKVRTWFWRISLVKLLKSFGHSNSREILDQCWSLKTLNKINKRLFDARLLLP